MKNVIKYKGYTIIRYVVAKNFLTDEIVGEFDSMADAKRMYKSPLYIYKYAACEAINDRGDTNPSVYGSTLAEATNKLKGLLNT